MFKKAKPTFLSRAGRLGAPSARKPFAKKTTKPSAKKRASAISGNTRKVTKKVIKNGKVAPTTKMKGAVNSYRTAKANSHKTLARPMSKAPKGKTKSTPMSYRPRG